MRIKTYQAAEKSADVDKGEEVKAQIWHYDVVLDAVKLNIEEWDVQGQKAEEGRECE